MSSRIGILLLRHASYAWIVLALALALPATAEELSGLPRLRFDPFAARTLRAGAAQSAGPFAPVLRATLVSEENGLANLGGRILRLGEESHGYRLVAVREGEAEFETEGGGRLVLQVVEQQAEDEDE